MLTYIALLASALLIGIDQWIKWWAVGSLAGSPSLPVFPGLLQLTYVENRGAAFGIMQGQTVLLSAVTFVVIVIAVVMMVKKILSHPFVVTSVALIIAGGVGNLIDRIFRGFVVDYIDVSPLIDFPVFNFADCCVVIGTILFLIYVIFIDGKKPKKTVDAPQSEGDDA